jgi:hypothetical protein
MRQCSVRSARYLTESTTERNSVRRGWLQIPNWGNWEEHWKICKPRWRNFTEGGKRSGSWSLASLRLPLGLPSYFETRNTMPVLVNTTSIQRQSFMLRSCSKKSFINFLTTHFRGMRAVLKGLSRNSFRSVLSCPSGLHLSGLGVPSWLVRAPALTRSVASEHRLRRYTEKDMNLSWR